MSDDVTLSQPEGQATGKKLLWFQQEPQIGGGGGFQGLRKNSIRIISRG